MAAHLSQDDNSSRRQRPQRLQHFTQPAGIAVRTGQQHNPAIGADAVLKTFSQFREHWGRQLAAHHADDLGASARPPPARCSHPVATPAHGYAAAPAGLTTLLLTSPI